MIFLERVQSNFSNEMPWNIKEQNSIQPLLKDQEIIFDINPNDEKLRALVEHDLYRSFKNWMQIKETEAKDAQLIN